jgi:hypothetical protein
MLAKTSLAISVDMVGGGVMVAIFMGGFGVTAAGETALGAIVLAASAFIYAALPGA